MLSRHEYFLKRLKELGFYEPDSDYGGMIGPAVEQLSEVFSKQGHLGFSAKLTLNVMLLLCDEWENPEIKKE